MNYTYYHMKYLYFIVCFLFLFACPVVARRSGGGTYRYVNKRSGKTHYVGATNNFQRRHNEHVRSDHYYTKPEYKFVKNHMTGNYAKTEREQIKKYKPLANKNRGGGGL